MKSSYNHEDVILLIKDLSKLVQPVSLEERARRVAAGEFERSILIEEYVASEEYLKISWEMGKEHFKTTAHLVGLLAEKIYEAKGKDLVLVSIIRAGIPVGILVKRYLKAKYDVEIPHYGISLVKGLDENAMKYILEKHPAEGIQFIDGWTGKGTVTDELVESAKQYHGVDASLAVLCDPIHVAKYAGCYNDVCIPSAPFNACCTGLVSITVFNNEYVKDTDFHGAVYLEHLEKMDMSKKFLQQVEDCFCLKEKPEHPEWNQILSSRVSEAKEVSEAIQVPLKQINPGINEAARAILRRKLDRLLVMDENDPEVNSIVALARLKGAQIETYPLKYYKAVSVAKE